MDQATQQNAAMVEESTAASHKLTSEAEVLRALLSQFRLGNEMQHRPAARHTSPALQLVSRVARAHGSAVPAADNWEEF
jgi:methyl-accepting chemotaxis protein